jgi:hypothetical protein
MFLHYKFLRHKFYETRGKYFLPVTTRPTPVFYQKPRENVMRNYPQNIQEILTNTPDEKI